VRRSRRQESERPGAFAKGGKTAMHGRGDRTVTAASEAAGRQAPGSTGHKTSGKGTQFTGGGKRLTGASVSTPAKPGRTSPVTKGR
jgi:hypothetical protein